MHKANVFYLYGAGSCREAGFPFIAAKSSLDSVQQREDAKKPRPSPPFLLRITPLVEAEPSRDALPSFWMDKSLVKSKLKAIFFFLSYLSN